MSNAARNEVLSSFGETINNSLAEMDRQKASKTPFHPIFQFLSLAMPPRLKSVPVFLSNP